MINKRLIGAVGESKKYIVGNVICQWISLMANISMMAGITNLLAKLFERKAEGLKMHKLNIDYKKHPAYRKKTGKILRKRLEQKYGKENGVILFKEMNRYYEKFVADMPYTGGKDNPLWDQLYDSAARGDAICDYRYVASKGEIAKNYPVKRDDNGYLYNDLPM